MQISARKIPRKTLQRTAKTIAGLGLLLLAFSTDASKLEAKSPEMKPNAKPSLFRDICTWDKSGKKKTCRPRTWDELPWWERCGKLTEDGEEFDETRDECRDRLVMGKGKSRRQRQAEVFGDDQPWFSDCKEGEGADKCMDRVLGKPEPSPECKKGEAWRACAKRTAKEIRARMAKGIWTDKCKKGEDSIKCYRRLFPTREIDEEGPAFANKKGPVIEKLVGLAFRMRMLKALKRSINKSEYMANLCDSINLRYALEKEEYEYLCSK